MEPLIIVAAVLISLAIGIFAGMTIRKKVAESKIESAEQESKRLVELAKIEAEKVCIKYRKKGMNVPIFRPMTFVGPERLGVFSLFYLLKVK